MTVQAQTQKILIENKIGRKMWVWDSDSFYTSRLKMGPYQKQNLLRLRELCPNPRKILDIGMNIGMNTWEYATFAQEVHGFEPVPGTYQVALDNIALNQNHQDPSKGWWKNQDGTWASLAVTGKIQTYNVALGPVKGSVEMHIKKNDGHNRVAMTDILRLMVSQLRLIQVINECRFHKKLLIHTDSQMLILLKSMSKVMNYRS